MPSAAEIREQVDHESERRVRLGVPAFAGGFLYVLSAIIISSTLNGAPTVGLLQGLTSALSGVANPAVSPRTAEVKFVSHHAFGLITGSVLAAVAIGVLTLVVLMLINATRFRRLESWSGARLLILIGGISLPLLNLLHAIVLAIKTNSFAVGHDFTNQAVERALLTAGSGGLILGLTGLLAALALAAGMAAAMIASMRVGLLPRWLGVLGIFAGLLFLPFFGSATFELVPAFWLVGMGILLMGRWPKGEPPAWAAGEARPWPSQAAIRAEQAQEDKVGGNQSARSQAKGDPVPEPSLPASGQSGKRRRKRGSRR